MIVWNFDDLPFLGGNSVSGERVEQPVEPSNSSFPASPRLRRVPLSWVAAQEDSHHPHRPRRRSAATTEIMERGEHVEELNSCIRSVAFDSQNVALWGALEVSLRTWREPCDGGTVNSDYVDDNLHLILSSGTMESVFHLSKMTPSEITHRCIPLARDIWTRIVAAIERAAIVSRIRRRRRARSSPCLSDGGSPTFCPPRSPTYKCK